MRAAALLAIACLAASATIARADEPVPPKARRLAALGRTLHEQGDYARAIAAFQEAYVLAPRPGLLFNIAQAYRLQGNCDDAELVYRRYIAARPPAEERALAQQHLATVVRCLKQRELDRANGALTALAGSRADAAAERERERGRLTRRIGLGVTLGGAAVLAAAAYFGIRAHNTELDVERRYAQGTRWPDLEPLHERGARDASAARWLAVGGGATASAGLVMILLGRRAEHATPVSIVPARRGAQIGVAWAF
jgi:tetratricopeptide (TPR) repeat protein